MTTFRKTCSCKGSFSGPRIIFGQQDRGDVFVVTATLVPLACDTCSAPLEVLHASSLELGSKAPARRARKRPARRPRR